jgi:hypothetical protein
MHEHVSGARGFGWRDTEALAENSDPVCQTRSVPQQLAIANLRLEGLCLANNESIEKIQGVVVVRGSVGVFDVPASMSLSQRKLKTYFWIMSNSSDPAASGVKSIFSDLYLASICADEQQARSMGEDTPQPPSARRYRRS